jgi:hypothetical protein
MSNGASIHAIERLLMGSRAGLAGRAIPSDENLMVARHAREPLDERMT